jgi:hypothetical protein
LSLVENTMNRSVTHPTKEQVRAYMLERGHAWRPPPPPDEIRRQLGWHVVTSSGDCTVVPLFWLPMHFAQLAFEMALGCCLCPPHAAGADPAATKH